MNRLRAAFGAPSFPRTFTLLLTALFLAQYLLYARGALVPCVNYRIQTGQLMQNAHAMATAWAGGASDYSLAQSQDDLGAYYLLAALYSARVAGPPTVPESYFFLMSLPYLLTLWLLFYALSRLVSRGFATGFTLLFALSSLGRAFAFAGDVYAFPTLALAASLAWAARLRESTRRWWAASLAIAAALFACALFRSMGPFPLATLTLALVFPRTVRVDSPRTVRLAAALGIAAYGILCAVGAPPRQHAVWRSVHAGLFENGGWLDPATKIATPAFAPPPNVPGPLPFDGWSDEIEETMTHRLDPAYRGMGDYRPAHEAYFRDEVLAWARRYPLAIARLGLRRAWNLLRVNPWPETEPSSKILPREPIDTGSRLLLLLVIAGALAAGVARKPEFWIFASLLAYGAPPLLVHSGYLMYNAPAVVALLLLGAYCARAVFVTVRQS